MWKVNNTKMHGLSEIGPNVPAFLIKLWKLVNSPETDELICWSESGLSFLIINPAQFSRELLSLYYKHNNMASFIRQLNMYGFHKIVSEGGGLKNDNIKNKCKDCMEFAHQCFIKGHPYLLENIKRKLPNPKSGVISNEQINNSNLKNGTQSEILAKMLSDVNNLKGKQESWDARLNSMKRENEALWRELAIFRQKHLKQEQIINRLIHFIVTIVQPSRNVPLRRRYPLMLSGIQPVKKITKLSGADNSQFNQGSPTGPTIHEIDTSDVLFGSPDQPEVHSADEEFISSDFVSTPKFVEIESSEIPEIPVVEKEAKVKPSIEIAENIPEDWLEIQLTEDNMIDPLTPIDPAKVNPAVAAATLKHLEDTNKKVTSIAVTLPSVTTTTESGKKNTTEKKVIYLTGGNNAEKFGKKNAKKSLVLKLDPASKKSNSKSNTINASSSSADLFLDLVSNKVETLNNLMARPAAKAVKRKASNSSLTVSTPKSIQTTKKKVKKTDSKTCVPELEIDDLDFLLTSKKSDDELAEPRECNKPDKTSGTTGADSFLKLQSLYNGTISEDNLDVSSPDDSLDLGIIKENESAVDSVDKLPSPSFIDSEKLTSEQQTDNTNDVLNFEPDSMAVVCQNSGSTDILTRELSSHVDSVQGEIDYLKEMLKGEGYNFDTNTLPWLFNDDPLSYGVLPADTEDNEKKNEEAGISGNELMTYGTPNLMDLVDMVGSSPSNQDWAAVLSPPSSIVSDIATPVSCPSPFSFQNPNKRRKM